MNNISHIQNISLLLLLLIYREKINNKEMNLDTLLNIIEYTDTINDFFSVLFICKATLNNFTNLQYNNGSTLFDRFHIDIKNNESLMHIKNSSVCKMFSKFRILNRNIIDEELIDLFKNVKRIKYLDISCCNLLTSKSFLYFRDLETLIMKYCNQESVNDEAFSQLNNLIHLDIQSCYNKEKTISSKALINVNPGLLTLNITNCNQFNDESLSKFTKLKTLIMNNCHNSGITDSMIHDKLDLEIIHMDNCSTFTNNAFINLKKLVVLSKTKVSNLIQTSYLCGILERNAELNDTITLLAVSERGSIEGGSIEGGFIEEISIETRATELKVVYQYDDEIKKMVKIDT